MPERNKQEAKKFAVEMLEKEILHMKGRHRREAMRKYRRLLSTLNDDPTYFMRT